MRLCFCLAVSLAIAPLGIIEGNPITVAAPSSVANSSLQALEVAWEDAGIRANDAMIRGDVAAAAAIYFQACKLRRALNLLEDTSADHPLSMAKAGDQSFRRVGRLKLRHDAEQFEYLVGAGKLAMRPFGRIAEVYRNILPQLPRDIFAVDLQPGAHRLLDRAYNRAVNLLSPARVAEGTALASGFDAAALESRFHQSELTAEAHGCEAQNGVAYADGVLSEEVLSGLKTWCMESTMWFSSRSGYVAAFFQEAFNSPLVVQVAEELRKALPDVLGPHELMNIWAFKYANNASDWDVQGTAVHADVAAVNVNLWITDDDANEDPEGGGLVIYTKQAPREWGFTDYNSMDKIPTIRKYLGDSSRVTVPHKQNRIVLFNSNLFHETQTPRFRSGYSSRRINLTFLFGRRCSGLDVNEGYDQTANLHSGGEL